MTSGSRGIHVVAPLRRGPDSNTVRTRAGELAEELAGRLPDQLTTSWRKEGRGGRVLVDAARNTYAQTAVAPYAVRAKPGAPVATPLFWDEVADAEPRGWTLRDVPARLEERGDPWEGIALGGGVAPRALSRARLRPQLAELVRGEPVAERRRVLEQVVAGHEQQRARLPDRDPVVAPGQLGDPARARLDGARLEPRQALGDVGGRVGVAHPDRVAVVARQRVAVGAVLAVLEARQRRRLAHRIGVARVGRDAHREVEAGARAGSPCRGRRRR